ncbi:MAG: ATP-dependent nuclease [Promethearchaeota archaeon]
MKIKKVAITNFRTIKSAEFYFFPYMVFVGKNNSGKSNIMKALDVFFGRKPVEDDFRLEGKKRENEISITLTFIDLLEGEKNLYQGNILFEGTEKAQVEIKLTILHQEKMQLKYEIAKLIPDLSSSAAKNRYGFLYDTGLISKKEFQEDPDVPDEFKQLMEEFIAKKKEKMKKAGKSPSSRLSKGDMVSLKTQYIKQHPEISSLKMTKQYVKSKIGTTNISRYLGNYYFIPAVQDIDEETTYKAKGATSINRLMNYILDQMRDEEKEQEHNQQIREIMKKIYQIDNSSSELNKLAFKLNDTLKEFDGSKIRFDTVLPNINKMVRDSLKIYMNDGVDTLVSEKGHGLQRYFMVSLFKIWAETLLVKNKEEFQKKSDGDGESIDLVPAISNSVYFAIEEPELFLHPQYQDLMQNYLLKIASTDNHQIILNTHAPNFIDFNDYKSVAKVLKSKNGAYEATTILQPIEEIDYTLKIKDIIHAPRKDSKKIRRINEINLSYYMNPNRSELFFADKVVLVEGETEKIMLQRWADYFFPDLVAKRVTTTYVDCNGKFNMQLYQEMLNGFQIPYVIIIDDDRGSSDRKMSSLNYHIKRIAESGNGHFITLDIDFENEFEITGHDLKRDGVSKKNKPYQAFIKFFDEENNPKVEELEKLRKHPKLQQIFFSVYQEKI